METPPSPSLWPARRRIPCSQSEATPKSSSPSTPNLSSVVSLLSGGVPSRRIAPPDSPMTIDDSRALSDDTSVLFVSNSIPKLEQPHTRKVRDADDSRSAIAVVATAYSTAPFSRNQSPSSASVPVQQSTMNAAVRHSPDDSSRVVNGPVPKTTTERAASLWEFSFPSPTPPPPHQSKHISNTPGKVEQRNPSESTVTSSSKRRKVALHSSRQNDAATRASNKGNIDLINFNSGVLPGFDVHQSDKNGGMTSATRGPPQYLTTSTARNSSGLYPCAHPPGEGTTDIPNNGRARKRPYKISSASSSVSLTIADQAELTMSDLAPKINNEMLRPSSEGQSNVCNSTSSLGDRILGRSQPINRGTFARATTYQSGGGRKCPITAGKSMIPSCNASNPGAGDPT